MSKLITDPPLPTLQARKSMTKRAASSLQSSPTSTW